VMSYHAWAHIAVDALAAPLLLARIRIQAQKTILHADHQFDLSRWRLGQEWRVPGAADALGPPDFLPGHLVQGYQRPALDAGVDDHQVFVKQRRSARAPAIDSLPDRGVPLLVAVQIEAEHPGFAEEDVEPLAVTGRRAGAVAVVGAFPLVLVFR